MAGAPALGLKERQLKTRILIALMAAAALLGAGCKSKPPLVEKTAPSAETTFPNTNPNAQSSGVATVNAGSGTSSNGALGPDGPLGSQRVIYFDFDSSDIRNEYVDVIAAHGKFLAANATVRVRLEGHTDERGSREYNIGLGERRAQTVRRALALQGVQESQITTVSYGEERPAAAGSDESAYSKNRRVEIVYIN
jgi:peptidoglycan-associated lipoprotein